MTVANSPSRCASGDRLAVELAVVGGGRVTGEQGVVAQILGATDRCRHAVVRGEPGDDHAVDTERPEPAVESRLPEGAVDPFRERRLRIPVWRLSALGAEPVEEGEPGGLAPQRGVRLRRVVTDVCDRPLGPAPRVEQAAGTVLGVRVVAWPPAVGVEPALEVDQQKRRPGHDDPPPATGSTVGEAFGWSRVTSMGHSSGDCVGSDSNMYCGHSRSPSWPQSPRSACGQTPS